MKAVAVVVLSWNKKQDVIDCIGRVKKVSGANLHVVVVDNGSRDDSVEAIRGAHPDVTVIEAGTNRGFAGGVNLGLAEAAARGADYAWLLNDDTSFDDSVLAPLLAYADAHPACGLLSPTLKNTGPDPIDQFRNGLMDWDAAIMEQNLSDATYRRKIEAGATPIVAGTALLCDLRLYRAIGPFDERFFAYWEDTDYSIRAVRAGYSIDVVASSVMLHAATPTRHHRPPHYHYYMVRNEALFWRLHYPKGRATGWKRRWLARSLEWIAQNRDLGNADNVDAGIDGIWHAFTRRYGSRESHPPAPGWLRRLLTARPYLVFGLVRGDLPGLLKRLLRVA